MKELIKEVRVKPAESVLFLEEWIVFKCSYQPQVKEKYHLAHCEKKIT